MSLKLLYAADRNVVFYKKSKQTINELVIRGFSDQHMEVGPDKLSKNDESINKSILALIREIRQELIKKSSIFLSRRSVHGNKKYEL